MASSWLNSWFRSWGNSWGQLAPVEEEEVTGGGNGVDVKGKKRHRLSEMFDIIEPLEEIVVEPEDLKPTEEAPEVIGATEEPQETTKAYIEEPVSYDLIAEEIGLLHAEVDALELSFQLQKVTEEDYLRQKQELDDEIAILFLNLQLDIEAMAIIM